ncbi:hypothetical protein HD598_000360 [Neomicrococcus aestuarii]|uniref:Ankyrin repeat domain-containing protein n=1 Tax=Neomicrococcus aestuarii TaxID=556325 RepID=A0A7W8TRY9_9MICC|nr:ankyrin repeat domain-containing protein [Neomicrococcus aestuarii]MBB5511673.1 hypothetical protein [Neomicrococcus aestuarii]
MTTADSQHDDDFERAISMPNDNPSGLSPEQLAFVQQTFDMARAGDERLAELIRQGIPADIKNDKGDTFLILAAYNGHLSLVRALVQVGANVNEMNAREQSALTCAVFRNDRPMMQFLMDHGADPDLGAQSARATAAAFGVSAEDILGK